MAHNVTSDSHDAGNRPPSIAPEVQQAGFGELVGWLTDEVPAAILAGGQVPARPPRRGTRRACAPAWRGALRRA